MINAFEVICWNNFWTFPESVLVTWIFMSSLQFQETLHIYGPESTLHVNLLGRGVNPTIQLNLEDRLFDMGAVLVNEYVERTFKVCYIFLFSFFLWFTCIFSFVLKSVHCLMNNRYKPYIADISNLIATYCKGIIYIVYQVFLWETGIEISFPAVVFAH